jgi:small subunit ribosomal protein S9
MNKATSSNYHGVGRRKSSVARVWLKKGSGNILVNGLNYTEYFDTKDNKDNVVQPLKVLSLDKQFDVDVNVAGGGLTGQSGAVRLGISRALLSFDEKFKSVLKKYRFLTVDSRVKERKKYGQKAARRKFQFVKR